MSVPTRISIVPGVTISNRRNPGVIASRLWASAKKGKTSSGEPGRTWERSGVWTRAVGLRAVVGQRSRPRAGDPVVPDDELVLAPPSAPEALGMLSARHERAICGFFLRRTRNAELAADLT